jgi:L-alanine-DL-glutamate epimerase-like enolase superfamily enzyme
MKITRLDTFILHVPVTGDRIADSVHQVTHWGAPGVIVHTDQGIRGCGYTGTLGHLPTDRLIRDCIGESFGPLLVEQDPLSVRHLWQRLYQFPAIRWVGRAGIAQMALAALDIALWDIKAKAAGMPLWRLLGGSDSARLEAYNTDGGWLDRSREELVANARRIVEEEGFRGVKIKVGSPDPHDDLERLEAVRQAIGPRVKLMVDGNGLWDLPTAVRVGRRFADYDVYWFEEPVGFDDVRGHAELARAIGTPIALGEQLYSIDAFRSFLEAGAVHYVQPDATRLGGVTCWWQAADLALAHRRPVCAHVGDMMQVHQHLSIAHPVGHLLEYIPWLRACFQEPATVEAGYFKIPQAPGAGTTLRDGALDEFGVQ